MVLAHVNELGCLFYGSESRLTYCFWRANKSHYRSVGTLSGICIQQLYSLYLFNFSSDFADQLHIVSLAEIGNTFNDLIHACGYLR
jgi:hypothetical protein